MHTYNTVHKYINRHIKIVIFGRFYILTKYTKLTKYSGGECKYRNEEIRYYSIATGYILARFHGRISLG